MIIFFLVYGVRVWCIGRDVAALPLSLAFKLYTFNYYKIWYCTNASIASYSAKPRFPLCAGKRTDQGFESGGAGGTAYCHCRTNGLRKDHTDQFADAFLRCG